MRRNRTRREEDLEKKVERKEWETKEWKRNRSQMEEERTGEKKRVIKGKKDGVEEIEDQGKGLPKSGIREGSTRSSGKVRERGICQGGRTEGKSRGGGRRMEGNLRVGKWSSSHHQFE